jgi:deferrochelatase/peroxidase EfeB
MFDAADSNDLRQKLADVAAGIVTSALQQHVETRQYKDFRIPGAIFGNVFLTAGGYRALGLAEAELGAVLPDPLFLKGMHSETSFNDPPPAKWEKGYRDGEIDAMFLLADDDRDYLQRQGRDLINQLDKFCRICAVEQGDALRNKENNEGIEHFGYVDGRSQPIYLKGDEEKEGTMNKWNPIEPLSLVLAADALAGSGHWGSYFVFRKLEQDVLSFKTREQKLADELGFVTEEERERAGAMAVGRFEDGTPVVLSPNDGYIPLKENDFDYGVDDERPDPNDPAKIIPGGLKCPYHAHIRKTNPRGDTVRKFKIDERLERAHRITRRGITYGQRKKHPNDAQALADYPTKGVGLFRPIIPQLKYFKRLESDDAVRACLSSLLPR